jgi:TonB family protein
VSQPAVAYKVDPEYSDPALKLRAAGTVLLQFVVDIDEKAKNIKVVRSLGYGLEEKAIESVRKWRFKPGMKNGTAVPVYATVEVNFTLVGLRRQDSWYSNQMAFASEAGVTAPIAEDGTMPKPVRELSDESVVLEFTVESSGSVKTIHPIHGSESVSRLLTGYLAKW